MKPIQELFRNPIQKLMFADLHDRVPTMGHITPLASEMMGLLAGTALIINCEPHDCTRENTI